MLEAAVDRRIEIDRSADAAAEQVHALDADRSKLAAELDAQTAQARELEAANREIARRLDAAMENIRLVLDRSKSMIRMGPVSKIMLRRCSWRR